jgi:predicted RNA-binding Zn-ribbon protein involved in translation (DUF1610 family)
MTEGKKERIRLNFNSHYNGFTPRHCPSCGKPVITIARMNDCLMMGGRSWNCPDPECSLHTEAEEWREI